MTKEGFRMDPPDWEVFRAEMQDLLNICVDRMAETRALPWEPVPSGFEDTVRLQDAGRNVMGTLTDTIMPTATGNTHPGFFGWVHGTGQAMGLASELVAATMNSNCGGRDHGAIRVEQEVLRWLCDTAGLPAGSGGILTTGTSQATIYALCAARLKMFGNQIREDGIAALPPLRVYAAMGAHSCVKKALQVMGHGSVALRGIALKDGSMNIDALETALAEDRANGITPLAIVGTAGSVNTGTYDNFNALADIAARDGIWLHADAAFGYWIRLADAPWCDLADGIERVNSIALDGHKWLGVPYECGACLVQDQHDLRAAFSERAEYLAPQTAGIAAGDWWPTDYGTELSRGFRALKFWTAIQTHGRATIGQVITDNCRQAALMGELADASDYMELAQPVVSNLCVFRPKQGNASELAVQLQLDGTAIFSTTTIDGENCLRAAIVNHRTTSDDIRIIMAALETAIKAA